MDKIVEICDTAKARIKQLYSALRSADDDEKEVLYDRIEQEKNERDEQASKWLTNKNVLILVLRHYEKNAASDWHIYAALMNSPVYEKFMWDVDDDTIVTPKVVEDKNGKYEMYGMKFAIK